MALNTIILNPIHIVDSFLFVEYQIWWLSLVQSKPQNVVHQKGINNKDENHELKWQRASQFLPHHVNRWSTSTLVDPYPNSNSNPNPNPNPNPSPNPNPNHNCYIRMVTK